MLKLKLQYFGHWWEELTHWIRPWCWERLTAGGEGGSKGWDGWMASPTQWTWIWPNSGRSWRIGKPGVLQSMGSQKVRHDLETEQHFGISVPNSRHRAHEHRRPSTGVSNLETWGIVKAGIWVCICWCLSLQSADALWPVWHLFTILNMDPWLDHGTSTAQNKWVFFFVCLCVYDASLKLKRASPKKG